METGWLASLGNVESENVKKIVDGKFLVLHGSPFSPISTLVNAHLPLCLYLRSLPFL